MKLLNHVPAMQLTTKPLRESSDSNFLKDDDNVEPVFMQVCPVLTRLSPYFTLRIFKLDNYIQNLVNNGSTQIMTWILRAHRQTEQEQNYFQ